MSSFSNKLKSDWRRIVRSLLAVIIVSGSLYSGFVFFSTVRALVARTSLPFVDNVAKTAPGRAPQEELPDIAEKKERVNILLLGIDQRENDYGPWRTDTMILIGIDPATNSASMLSIPRDLWVRIPGFEENRINAAHAIGDAQDYPGGGVALAKKTVSQNFGVPVHYYVRINFTGFEKLVDAVGGLEINVEQAIHDDDYPDGNYGTMVVDIPAGLQHMDGKTALQYARSRHGTGDFDRMTRQQSLIIAARDKMLGLDIPLSRLPKLLELAGDAVRTDMTLAEMRDLAPIVLQIDRANVRAGVIDDSMTIDSVTPQGWMVEVPDWDKIGELVASLFPGPLPAIVPTPSLAQAQLEAEGARIELLNGTLAPDLAQKTAEWLSGKGFDIARFDNADRFDYAETFIIVYADKLYTVDGLMVQLDVKAENIRHEAQKEADIDIRVILGRDHAQRVGQDSQE